MVLTLPYSASFITSIILFRSVLFDVFVNIFCKQEKIVNFSEILQIFIDTIQVTFAMFLKGESAQESAHAQCASVRPLCCWSGNPHGDGREPERQQHISLISKAETAGQHASRNHHPAARTVRESEQDFKTFLIVMLIIC